jgi:ADP-heptose:LPS heptosyltransferase
MAAVLKEAFPGVKVSFLGKGYTQPVIEACEYVDQFIDEADFLNGSNRSRQFDAIVHVLPKAHIARKAKALGIPVRIGTTNRLFHWWTCSKLVRLGRKNSLLHESQLNIKLLSPLGIRNDFSLAELGNKIGLHPKVNIPSDMDSLISQTQPNVILHPKSQGSAREWGLDNFADLAKRLSDDGCKVFISGTKADAEQLQPLLSVAAGIATDITGRMDLSQFIAFIQRCDALVAASTGPLHLASALGKVAIGLYPPIRPMHPGRWAPIGPKSVALEARPSCVDCKSNPSACHCMQEILPARVEEAVRLQMRQ